VLGHTFDSTSDTYDVYVMSTVCGALLDELAADVNDEHSGTVHEAAAATGLLVSGVQTVFTVVLFVDLNENRAYDDIDEVTAVLPNVDLRNQLNYRHIASAFFFSNVGVSNYGDGTYAITLNSYHALIVLDTQTFFTGALVGSIVRFEGIRLDYPNKIIVNVDLDKAQVSGIHSYLAIGLSSMLIRTGKFSQAEQSMLMDSSQFFNIEMDDVSSMNGTYADHRLTYGASDGIFEAARTVLQKLRVNGTFLYLPYSVLCEVVPSERIGFDSIEASLGALPAHLAASDRRFEVEAFAVGNFFVNTESIHRDATYWAVLGFDGGVNWSDVRRRIVERSVKGVYWSFRYTAPMQVELDWTDYTTIEAFVQGHPADVAQATFNTQDEALDYGVLRMHKGVGDDDWDFDLGTDEGSLFDMVSTLYEDQTGASAIPKGTGLRWDSYSFTASASNLDVLNSPFGVSNIDDVRLCVCVCYVLTYV
jgi:uncharacterized protein (UPF0548 family)